MPRSRRRRIGARSASALRTFLEIEASGGILLLAAAAVALVSANSPWADSYERFWTSPVDLGWGALGFDGDLRHLVNEGLMTIFFFVVGLEIKRELVAGELHDRRVARLPVVAALGGMLVPAAIYLAINPSGRASQGWGIPMATDIAFAIGVLSLFGPRIPASLRLFLLSLAIVDDIGAILVIAVFYTDDLEAGALAVAVALLAGTIVLQRHDVRSPVVYLAVGVVCWLALRESGVHATLAGVAFGLLTPAETDDDEPTAVERWESRLHPLASLVIVPLFALANAGVKLTADAFDADGARVALGVGVGLVAGKILGILIATGLAVRIGLATLPADTTWRHVGGAAALAGIGFTVSIFIADLAFAGRPPTDAAKIAILAASVMASLLGAVMLVRARTGP